MPPKFQEREFDFEGEVPQHEELRGVEHDPAAWGVCERLADDTRMIAVDIDDKSAAEELLQARDRQLRRIKSSYTVDLVYPQSVNEGRLSKS